MTSWDAIWKDHSVTLHSSVRTVSRSVEVGNRCRSLVRIISHQPALVILWPNEKQLLPDHEKRRFCFTYTVINFLILTELFSVKSPYVFPLSQIPLIYGSRNCVAVCSVVARKKIRIGVKFRDWSTGMLSRWRQSETKTRPILLEAVDSRNFLIYFKCILEIQMGQLEINNKFSSN